MRLLVLSLLFVSWNSFSQGIVEDTLAEINSLDGTKYEVEDVQAFVFKNLRKKEHVGKSYEKPPALVFIFHKDGNFIGSRYMTYKKALGAYTAPGCSTCCHFEIGANKNLFVHCEEECTNDYKKYAQFSFIEKIYEAYYSDESVDWQDIMAPDEEDSNKLVDSQDIIAPDEKGDKEEEHHHGGHGHQHDHE